MYESKNLDLYIDFFLKGLKTNSPIVINQDYFSISEIEEITLMYAAYSHKQIWRIEPQLIELLESPKKNTRLFVTKLLKVLTCSSPKKQSLYKYEAERIANLLLQCENISSMTDKDINIFIEQNVKISRQNYQQKFAFNLQDNNNNIEGDNLFPIKEILRQQLLRKQISEKKTSTPQQISSNEKTNSTPKQTLDSHQNTLEKLITENSGSKLQEEKSFIDSIDENKKQIRVLIDIYIKSKKYMAAIYALEKYLQLDSSNFDIQYNIVKTKVLYIKEQLIETHKHFSQDKQRIQTLLTHKNNTIIRGYKELIQERPTETELHYTLGVALFDEKQFNTAIKSFCEAYSNPRCEVKSHHYLARSFIKIGNPSLAKEHFIQALKTANQNSAIYKDICYDLADFYEQNDNSQQALEIFNKLCHKDISYKDVIQRRKNLIKDSSFDKLILFLFVGIAATIASSFYTSFSILSFCCIGVVLQNLYKKVENALKNNNYDLAIYILKDQILKTQPQDVKAQKLLLTTIRKKHQVFGYPSKASYSYKKSTIFVKIKFFRVSKNWQKVIQESHNYLTYDPDNISILCILSQAYFEKGYIHPVIYICEEIYYLDPDNIDNLLLLSRVHKNMENYDKAIFYCQKAAKLDPENSEIIREVKRIAAMKTTNVYNEARSSRDLIKDPKKAELLEKLNKRIRSQQDALEVLEFQKQLIKNTQKQQSLSEEPQPVVAEKSSPVITKEETKTKTLDKEKVAVSDEKKKLTLPQKAELPVFEKFLSEDAARPGSIERTIAQSIRLMKVLQYSLGLKCIVIINAIDLTVDAFSSYVTGIFRTWKTSKSIYRNVERTKNNSHVKELLAELEENRLRLSRLFTLSGYETNLYQDQHLPSFALKLIIESRGHLDEMKQDLSFLTSTQTKKAVSSSIKDTLMSYIPNPFSVFTAWKDLVILIWWMKYDRRHIEEMYADLIIAYHRIITILQEKDKQQPQKILLSYEQKLLKRLEKNLDEDGDLEYWIEKGRVALQRLIQMLTNPEKFIICSKWSKKDLITEIKSGNNHPKYKIELEKWLTTQVVKHLKSEKTSKEEIKLYYRESRLFRRRYKLQKKLSGIFV
ncbi:hypothetical protein [Candidatus Uabimicrobium sp. HlEnr_7]|uniref:hypothetical protein n=1 Tax=Candidatus Uabimicrobium helgolandensis TaxID=3095367 RepID=UPI003556674F